MLHENVIQVDEQNIETEYTNDVIEIKKKVNTQWIHI